MSRTQQLALQVEGSPTSTTVVLGPSLGTRLGMWDEIAHTLSRRVQVVRFDLPGHGGSQPAAAGLTIETLADTVAAQLSDRGIERYLFAGISISGAIGMCLGLRNLEQLRALLLCSSAPKFGEPQGWLQRADRVRTEGMQWLIEPTVGRWFPPGFRRTNPEDVDPIMEMLATTDPNSYAVLCDALAVFDIRSRLPHISVPTSVLAGSYDPTTDVASSRAFAQRIPEAKFVELAGSAHMATVTDGQRIVEVIQGQLDDLEP